jgi:hypothetical protein
VGSVNAGYTITLKEVREIFLCKKFFSIFAVHKNGDRSSVG